MSIEGRTVELSWSDYAALQEDARLFRSAERLWKVVTGDDLRPHLVAMEQDAKAMGSNLELLVRLPHARRRRIGRNG